MDSLFLILGIVFLFCLILPWVNLFRHNGLEEEVMRLRAELHKLGRELALLQKTAETRQAEAEAKEKAEAENKASEETSEEALEDVSPTVPATVMQEAGDARLTKEDEAESAAASTSETADAMRKERRTRLEQQFGARLPVWIGGIALALAGFFLVRYSIEAGLLSPTVRVVLGVIFAALLVGAAERLRRYPHIANNLRIAQALSGAGVACFYVAFFAASTLYDLIPSWLGFALMALTTAFAVVLSLRHGMGIAVLGLLGGFLTPILTSSEEPQAALLFFYLYLLIAGGFYVIRRTGWWVLALPLLAGGFIWVGVWLFFGGLGRGEPLVLGIFLAAVSFTIFAIGQWQKASWDEDGKAGESVLSQSITNYASLGGALIMMGLVSRAAGFDPASWGLFAILAMGAIALAAFDQRKYALVPFLAIGISSAMLLFADVTPPILLGSYFAGFAALFMLASLVLQWRSFQSHLWALTFAVSALSYYLIGWYRLSASDLGFDVPLFWGGIALLLASISVYALSEVMRRQREAGDAFPYLSAIYAACATAFLTLAIVIELPRDVLPVAIALEIAALGWLSTRFDMPALRALAKGLLIVFAIILMPQILLILELASYTLVEAELNLQTGVPIVDWPIFQLGLPAALFAIAARFFLMRGDDRLVHGLEYAAIILVSIMGYYLMRHAFHPSSNVLAVKAGFAERGTITLVLLVYGTLCLYLGRKIVRSALYFGGLALIAVGLFRIFYFDIIFYNPLWEWQDVGDWPIFNPLLITYALPVVVLYRVRHELEDMELFKLRDIAGGIMLFLSFVYISLSVRQIYQGNLLNMPDVSNAEIYTLSVAWLLYGLVLLFIGTLKNNQPMRLVSLLVMLLTVGKVFLYDASELQDIYRVLSFLGLGVSLIGLSWFYTRFVFTRGGEKEPEAIGKA